MSELTTVYLDLIMVFVVVCWGLAFVFPVVVLLCALTCPETLCKPWDQKSHVVLHWMTQLTFSWALRDPC